MARGSVTWASHPSGLGVFAEQPLEAQCALHRVPEVLLAWPDRDDAYHHKPVFLWRPFRPTPPKKRKEATLKQDAPKILAELGVHSQTTSGNVPFVVTQESHESVRSTSGLWENNSFATNQKPKWKASKTMGACKLRGQRRASLKALPLRSPFVL